MKKRRIEAEDFNNLSAKEQFDWIIDNKDIAILTLDNDYTRVTLKDDEDFSASLKEDLGDRSGVLTLLGILGITADSF
jgi:hypothetical protein